MLCDQAAAVVFVFLFLIFWLSWDLCSEVFFNVNIASIEMWRTSHLYIKNISLTFRAEYFLTRINIWNVEILNGTIEKYSDLIPFLFQCHSSEWCWDRQGVTTGHVMTGEGETWSIRLSDLQLPNIVTRSQWLSTSATREEEEESSQTVNQPSPDLMPRYQIPDIMSEISCPPGK